MGIIARQGIKASIVGFVGVALGAMIKLFIITKFLTPSEIGIIETVLKLGLIMMPFFLLGASPVIRKYFPIFQTEKDDGGLIFYSFVVMVSAMILFGGIYWLSTDFLMRFYPNSPELREYLHLPLIGVVLYASFLFLSSIATVYYRIVVPRIMNDIVNRVGVVVVVLLYGYFGYINSDQMINWYILAFYLFPLIGLWLYVRFVIQPKINYSIGNHWREIQRKTTKYNAFLLLSAVSAYIIQAIDVNMISGKLGVASAGIYTIAFYMGAVLQVPRKNLNSIAFPVINLAYTQGDTNKINNIYKKSSLMQFLAGCILFAGVWFNIDEIFQIIPNGDIYSEGKFVVLFIGLGMLFEMLTGVNKLIIEISKSYKYNLLINVVLSVLVILLNLIFIPLDNPLFGGINGAAVASMIAIVVSNLLAIGIVYWKYKIQPFQWQTLIPMLVLGLMFLIAPYKFQFNSAFLTIIVNSVLIVTIMYGIFAITGVSKSFDELVLGAIKKKLKGKE